MGRGFVLTLSVIAAAVEPVVAGEQDFIRYAMTQGGLLVVVLALLMYIKIMHQRELAEKDRLVEDKDEKLHAMIELAGEVKVALMRSLDASTAQATASAAQAASLQSMATALARIEERKAQR